MNIWSKVLVGLIFLASIGFFILAARALKTHQYWRDKVVALQAELATELDTQATLADEVRQLTLDLHKQLVNRGRVWYNCRPQQVSAETGEVTVMTQFPDPHRIEAQTVLWVFDQVDVRSGGSYLGQFTVAAIGGQNNRLLQLKPSMAMAQPDRARLQQSAARSGVAWALYEIMPTDDHHSLAGFDAELLKAVLPESSVEEYIMDGQLTTLEEVKRRGLRGKVFKVDQSGQVVKRTEPAEIQQKGLEVEVTAENERGMYVRQLRDYEELFRHYHLQHTAWVDRWQSTTRNVNYITQVRDDARRQQQYRQEERDRLVVERQKYSHERDVAAAHLKAVSGKLAQMRGATLERLKANQGLAGEIARIQRAATRLIDQETQRMAQLGTGR